MTPDQLDLMKAAAGLELDVKGGEFATLISSPGIPIAEEIVGFRVQQRSPEWDRFAAVVAADAFVYAMHGRDLWVPMSTYGRDSSVWFRFSLDSMAPLSPQGGYQDTGLPDCVLSPADGIRWMGLWEHLGGVIVVDGFHCCTSYGNTHALDCPEEPGSVISVTLAYGEYLKRFEAQ